MAPDTGAKEKGESKEYLKSNHGESGRDGGLRGWLVVLGSCVCCLFEFGVFSAIGPLLVAIQTSFEANALRTSWILSLLMLLEWGLGPLSNVCVKMIGARMTVMIGTAISTTGYLLSYFATSIEYLYFSLGVLVGLGYGIILPPGVGYFALFIKKRFAIANALTVMSGGVAIFIFPPILQGCIDMYGWRGTAMVFAAINAHMGISAALFRPTGVSDEEEREESVKGNGRLESFLRMCDCHVLFKYPAFIVFVASSFLCLGVGYVGVTVHLVARAKDLHLGSPEEIAFANSLLGIGSIVGRLLPSLEPCCRWQHRTSGFWYGLVMLLGGVLLLLVQVVNTYTVFAVYSSIIGLLSGLMYTLFGVVIKDTLSHRLFVAGFGFCVCVLAVGGFLGPLCAGYIYDVTGDYNNSFYFYGCFVSLGGIVMLVMEYWTSRQRRISSRRVEKADAATIMEAKHQQDIIHVYVNDVETQT